MYPIIEYAHSINKNTAEFTLKDFAGYMKWWMKQPIREDLMSKARKYNDAMKSRVELTINDMAEVTVEQLVGVQSDEVVADMGLTQTEVDALSWGITQLLGIFDFGDDEEMLKIGDSLTKLGQELEPLTTKGE